MLITTDDKKVIDWAKQKSLEDIKYLNVLIFGKKSVVDKLIEKFKLIA